MPSYFPLVIQQGANLGVWFALRQPDGSIANPLTTGGGYSVAKLQVRDKAATDGGTVLLELTTGNGGITLGALTDAAGASQSGYLYASAQATAMLVPWGEAVYDLKLSDGVNVATILFGPAILVPAATLM